MPDIGTDPVPEAMEFDPSGSPPRVPEPIFIVQNPTTGLIDMSLAGVEVPESCAELEPTAIAQCEFNQYLETLDGFPTLTPAKAPATAVLDVATLVENVLVVDASNGKPVDGLTVGFDADTRQVTIDRGDGWDIGRTYVLAVRGYDPGVKCTEGNDVVASPVFSFLRREESLTCGAAKVEDVKPDCKFFPVLEADLGDATAATLLQLESIRAAMDQMGLFAMAEANGVPRAETAVLWAFSTHSSPVAELDPTRGMAPAATGPAEVRVAFKGDLDAATLTPWTLDETGTVFLLDLTLLAQMDLIGGTPKFSISLDDNEIVLKAEADLAPGHEFGVLLTTGVKDKDGNGLVPSPVTVLLRATGPLVDEEGHSVVSGVTDAQAVELEAARAKLALLLGDPLFAQITKLTPKDLALVFSLVVPGKAPEGGEDAND